MKKFFLSLIVMVLAAINVNAAVNFTTSPADGSAVPYIKDVTFTFTDATVAPIKTFYANACKDANGKVVCIATIAKGTNSNEIVWTPGVGQISNDGTYTITIPAGVISINGTASTEDVNVTLTVDQAQFPPVVTVDNAAKVKVVDTDRNAVSIVNGSQNFTPGEYLIQSISGYTINKVELNGTLLTAPYGYYDVTLGVDDKLNITANYDPATSKVEFSLPYRKNVAEVVKTVAYSGGEVIEGWPTGMFEAANGYRMIISLDETNYKVDSVLVNGVKLRGSYGTYTIKNITEYTSVEIFADVMPPLPVVIVDNANKVKMINENYAEQTLVAGKQTFSAGNYMINSKVAGYTLNKVVLNGVEKKAPYGYYQLSLTYGDTLVVTADYDPANSKVLFELPYRKNTAGVVKTVTHSGATTAQITEWPTGMFEAANGYKMTFVLDETNYQVDSVLVNGVKVKGSYGSYSTTVKEYTDVEIFANEIADLNAKIVVAGVPDGTMIPEYASVHKGGSAYGEEISIKNGTTKFTVKENNNKIVIVPASGKKVYVAVNNALVDADATTGNFTVAVSEGDEIKVFPELEFTASPENGSTVENINKVTLTFPGFPYSGADYNLAIYDNAIMDASGNYVKNEAGENIKGTLTWGEEMNNQLVWQGGNKVTAPGTYTVVIPAGALRFGDLNIQPLYLTYTIADATPAVLQSTYPQANTKITELPDYVTFMFDKEVQQPTAVAIQNGNNDPMTIEPVDYKVIDGNTVYITLTDKTKEALGTLTADGVTVYVQLTETQQYDTHFTVAPEFAVESSTFTATGGKLTFNDNVDFVDYATEVKCYVSAVKTKNIATQATLTLDDSEYNVVNVTFADELPAGDYTLDIEEGVIMSTSEEPLASVSVPFTIEGVTPVTPDKTVYFTYENYSDEYPNYEDTDWGLVNGAQIAVEYYGTDSLVIKNWMNQEGYDLHVKYDATTGYVTAVDNAYGQYAGWAYCAPNASAENDWYSFVNLYNGSSWITDDEIYLGISFDYSTWYNYNLKDNSTPTAISNVEVATTPAKTGKYIINGKLVIVKNGKQYNMNGQMIK